MACFRCRESNYGSGIRVIDECKCIEWCRCKKDFWWTQPVRHDHVTCWKGGWNPLNTHTPEVITKYNGIPIIGYKFVRSDLTSQSGNDHRPWALRRTRKLKGKAELRPCFWGYHSSNEPGEAYSYVHSNVVLKVKRLGDMVDNGDKVVSRGLKVIGISWVGDLVSVLDEQLITREQFSEAVKKRLSFGLNRLKQKIALDYQDGRDVVLAEIEAVITTKRH